MTIPVRNRRLLTLVDNTYRRVVKFTQEDDSSIYITDPSLKRGQWVDASSAAPGGSLVPVCIPAAGKLSVHGSGVVHVKDAAGSSTLRIKGNDLISHERGTVGLRHLLTILPSEGDTVAGLRNTDNVIGMPTHEPFAFIFWAVPGNRALRVGVKAAFNVEDLEQVPPATGWGTVPLSTHSVVWFSYRTKHMSRWPLGPILMHGDGYEVPMFIGAGEGQLRIEIRRPNYTQIDDHNVDIAF